MEQNQIVTCTSVGAYPNALTRGRQYEVLAQDERGQLRIRGDNNRARKYPPHLFDFANNTVPILTAWRFDDPVDDPLNGRDATSNLVEVTLTLSDGTKRWCSLATLEYLKRLLEPRSDPARWGGAYEPALLLTHLIVMRDLAEATVDWTLHHYDRQGELMQISIAIEDIDIAAEEE